MEDPRTRGAKSPREAAKRARGALDLIPRLLLRGIGEVELKILKESTHPKTWRERGWDKHIQVGNSLDRASLEALRDLGELLRTVVAVAFLWERKYGPQVAALKKQAKELNAWWMSLTHEQQRVGVRAVETYGKAAFSELRQKAGLEEKVLYLEIAKYEIEKAFPPKIRRKVGSGHQKPQPVRESGPPGSIGRRKD
ncbi:hypothetical protein KKG46_02760 [Patescibacteria group bacterium]|nr:hypothetical protein [Patescibacteria group bacterium]